MGEDGDNFTGTVLDDEAATPIVFGAAPFTGSFAPFEPLAVLDGKNAQGTWTLRVTDSSFFNPGTLTGWSVSLTPAPSEKISPQSLGVSPGVSWFQVDGKTSSFGGEDVYAVDLTAGQRISAAVRTPEFGGFRSGNGTEVLIPDNQMPVTAEISVDEPFTISDVDVQVLIDHSFDADLDIFLVAPDGRRIELSTDNGDSGDVYLNTVFDDEAPVIISDPSAQALWQEGGGRSLQLSVLDGTNSMGRWQLELTDDNPGEEGTLLGWALALNSGIDSGIRIFGPQGELAANDDAVPPVFDSAIVNAVVPATGTYFIQVGSVDNNRGAYRLEAGIYDASVTSETLDSTNLDPLRASNNGNAAVLGVADGLGQSDVFTTTLNAGESVLVGATTPGGFFDPRIRITGPGNFSVTDDDSGPGFDSVLRFRAPESGAYTITLDYPSTAEFLDAISTGSYALSLAIIENASNDDLASARVRFRSSTIASRYAQRVRSMAYRALKAFGTAKSVPQPTWTTSPSAA